jgi:tetratricopeptide (TPR) repeat protein
MKENERLSAAFLRMHKPKEALPHIKDLLAIEPNSVIDIQNYCTYFEQIGDYAGVIRESQRLLDLYPATGGCLVERIGAFEKLHQHDKALAADALLKKYGFTGETFKLLFGIHGVSDSDTGIPRLEEQITRTPTCPDLYLKLSGILATTGQHEEAVRIALEGAKVAPVHSWVWRMLESTAGYSSFALNKTTRANICFRKATEGLKFDGRERPFTAAHALAAILTSRAQMHTVAYEPKEAINDLTLLINNHSPDPDFYVQRAKLFAAAKEFDKALKDCNDALLVAHENIPALEQRSLVLSALKRYNESANDLTVLLKHARDQTYLLQRATNYELAKQFDKALADYDTIIKMDKKEVMAYEQRARIYRKLGKLDLAVKDEAVAKSLIHGVR